MKRQYRLSTNRAFNYTYQKGKSYSNKVMVLFVAPTGGGLRVGFSISKKIGKSVVRNKTKRRLKGCFEELLTTLNINNYIVVARVGIDLLAFAELKAGLITLLNKAGAFREKR